VLLLIDQTAPSFTNVVQHERRLLIQIFYIGPAVGITMS
jgi:hypothetical protein